MLLTKPDYTKLVFGTYQKLRKEAGFSLALKDPTPKSVRDECLAVYQERPDKKDDPTLRRFFGVAAENNSYLRILQKSKAEKFKTVGNYLIGKAANTDDKNVELLAWLIDFRHRPYTVGMNVILSDNEKEILDSEEEPLPPPDPGPDTSHSHDGERVDERLGNFDDNTGDKTVVNTEGEIYGGSLDAIQGQVDNTNAEVRKGLEPTKEEVNKEPRKKNPWLMAGILLLLILLSGGTYLAVNKDKHCMYWTGDHYEKIDCDAEAPDKVVYDHNRWKNFRKITDLSTISESSIGVIHYYGNKDREYFTTSGKHPVETNRYVKVMTDYIYKKDFAKRDSLLKKASDQTKKFATNQ